MEELTGKLRESLRAAADTYDTPDREARVEQEVAETTIEMYRKIAKEPGDPVDFQDFMVMMTASSTEVDSGGEEGGEEYKSGLESPEQTADPSSTPAGGPLSSKPKQSILQRLLSRGSPRKGLDKMFGVDQVSPKTLKPLKKPSHRSQASWAAEVASPTLLRAHVKTMDRLDSHVVKTQIANEQERAPIGPGGGFGPARRSRLERLRTFINTYRSHIFILVLFYLITFGIYAERFWAFAMQTEHAGIRRITGWSVPVTRGCASSIAFTMSILLLTVCKNLISYLQTTRAARFIPFASAISFHILIAYTCAAFMLGHIVGHFFKWSVRAQRSARVTRDGLG
jgi:hypothetical protein